MTEEFGTVVEWVKRVCKIGLSSNRINLVEQGGKPLKLTWGRRVIMALQTELRVVK